MTDAGRGHGRQNPGMDVAGTGAHQHPDPGIDIAKFVGIYIQGNTSEKKDRR